jgi:hypothetical protein
VGAGEPGDLRQRLEDTGGGLAVDQRDQACAPAGQRPGDGVGLDGAPPLRADRHHLGAAALGNLDEEQAEAPALPHQHALARLHERDDGGLEPRAPGARHREGARVVRLEGEAREGHHLVHDRREGGVELAQQRRGHGAQHTRVGHGGPRPHEDA